MSFKLLIIQLTRFVLVGGLGSLVNLSIFYYFTSVQSIGFNAASVAAFVIAVTHNFTLNYLWTFKGVRQRGKNYFSSWKKYVAVNLVGFIVNISMLNFFVVLFGAKYMIYGQAIGIAGGMVFNFALSKMLVFTNPDVVP